MIPTVDDLRSSPMRHRFGDLFAPPGLTNFLGAAQVDVDPIAIRNLSFPPFSTSMVSVGGLFINSTYFRATGSHTTFVWYPDRIVRESRWDGWLIRSETALPVGRMGALVSVEVINEASERDLDLLIGIRGGLIKQTTPWNEPEHPIDKENSNALRIEGPAAIWTEPQTGATWVQAAGPAPDQVWLDGFRWSAHLRNGQRFVAHIVHTIDDVEQVALEAAHDLLGRFDQEMDAIRRHWNAELAAVFTPGNDRFSGSLPLLETSDEDLRRIYNMGALGVVYFKRESPHSVMGRTYDTLMPSYWQSVTFLWDYALSGQTHALLDPSVMRRHLEHWMAMDMHTCFGSEWLTGGPVGGWYSVNDYAMTRLIHEYVRWTGDRAWLDEQVPLPGGEPMSVRDHLGRFATNWERFRTPYGLADYGAIGNLLECVSTYVHEVAAMNAGNVWTLRAAADFADLDGNDGIAEVLRAQADGLVSEIQKLYVDGAGYWHTRFPDGTLVPVRHCYDFITVLAAMADDLSPTQREEMAAFCLRELKTDTWMRALSPKDSDAPFSVRPDHQWNGAYPAWPPQAVAGLYKIGRVDQAFAWLKGLARSANQGPFGQAHLISEVIDDEAGGARKAPPELPYITDWACSSSGSWVELVISSVFGVQPGLEGRIEATPAFGPLDPDSRLRGLRFQGRLYDVDRNGIRRA